MATVNADEAIATTPVGGYNHRSISTTIKSGQLELSIGHSMHHPDSTEDQEVVGRLLSSVDGDVEAWAWSRRWLPARGKHQSTLKDCKALENS
jgi:hypothetical protein